MSTRPTNGANSMNSDVCRSINDAIGKRLRQSLDMECPDMPPSLQRLIDEMRRREDEAARSGSC